MTKLNASEAVVVCGRQILTYFNDSMINLHLHVCEVPAIGATLIIVSGTLS